MNYKEAFEKMKKKLSEWYLEDVKIRDYSQALPSEAQEADVKCSVFDSVRIYLSELSKDEKGFKELKECAETQDTVCHAYWAAWLKIKHELSKLEEAAK